MRSLSLLLALLMTAPAALAQNASNPSDSFTIIAWNIEGAGSDAGTIKQQLKELEPYDILALSEVPKEAANDFASKWGAPCSVVGSSGGEARLVIAWDGAKFDKLGVDELKQIAGKEFAPGVQAAALVTHLRHKSTGEAFKLVMNHLARGSAELRKTQALLLAQWARENEKVPMIAVGGYNFDYDFIQRKGNESFDAFLNTGAWKWIEPKEWVDTNWADRNRDGKDDYPDSMLDFVFVSGPARQWHVSAEVVVRPGDFPDNEKTSDQRPIRTVVRLK